MLKIDRSSHIVLAALMSLVTAASLASGPDLCGAGLFDVLQSVAETGRHENLDFQDALEEQLALLPLFKSFLRSNFILSLLERAYFPKAKTEAQATSNREYFSVDTWRNPDDEIGRKDLPSPLLLLRSGFVRPMQPRAYPRGQELNFHYFLNGEPSPFIVALYEFCQEFHLPVEVGAVASKKESDGTFVRHRLIWNFKRKAWRVKNPPHKAQNLADLAAIPNTEFGFFYVGITWNK